MSTERWRVISDWHNTWLAAPADTRDQLRASFGIDHPELSQLADELAASSGAADGFLDTPALVLAARDLAQEEPSFPEGTVIGPYRIVALLARGGMGDVYRANDPRLGRDIAVKTLTNTERGDAQSIERFLQEARITASLDHPNIVKVFDVGMSNGRPYLVSELLDGEALRVPIGRGPASEEEARRIACAVTGGLVAAHARGLVHRDLKPENIFLTKSGTAKILDFGIAKLVQDPALPRGVATLTGVIMGTAGYLAPEQVNGEPVDARTDLFALGSILFELMTGQRAFARDHTVDTLHAIVHDDPPDLLPRGTALTAIVKRLLAKKPDDRFQSAADLLWALQQIGPTEVRAESPRSTHERPTIPSPGKGLGRGRSRERGDGPGGRSGLVAARTRPTSVHRAEPHAVHVVAACRHWSRFRTGRLTGRSSYRLHSYQRWLTVTIVRAIARLARCHGRRGYRRGQAAVLVARRHVDRLLCAREADEGGRHGWRAGRHL